MLARTKAALIQMYKTAFIEILESLDEIHVNLEWEVLIAFIDRNAKKIKRLRKKQHFNYELRCVAEWCIEQLDKLT